MRRHVHLMASIVALIGLADSLFLYPQGLSACSLDSWCHAVHGCWVDGIPAALRPMGTCGFLVALLLSLLPWRSTRRALLVLATGMGAVGLAILVTQKEACHALCSYCIVSDVAALVLGALAWAGRKEPFGLWRGRRVEPCAYQDQAAFTGMEGSISETSTLVRQGTRGARPSASWTFTAFDVIGLSFAAFGLLWSAAAVISVQPSIVQMFADFGGVPPTDFCLKPWFAILLGILPVGLVASGIALGATRKTRVILMAVTIVLALALRGIVLTGQCVSAYVVGCFEGPIR